MELYEAGTDISAIAWKSLQQPQIQSQLDKPHNFNNNNNNNNKKPNESKYLRKRDTTKSRDSSLLKLINVDSYLAEKKKRKASKNTKRQQQVDLDYRYYNSELKNSLLYKYVYLIYEMMRDEKELNFNKYILREDEDLEIPVNMAEFILGPDYKNKRLFKIDVCEIFSSMAHFIDFRKSKIFVEYMLSDGVKRFGLTVNHLIFPAIPMWLFDACSLVSKDPSLYLIYSTDIRSVNAFLGHITSIVNLSNLLFLKIEQQNTKINATLILIHLTGIFTPDKYNPINRQGIRFPCSTLQRITFENVKNNMIKAAKEKRVYDNLFSFISSTIVGIPRVTGTNSFNLISY